MGTPSAEEDRSGGGSRPGRLSELAPGVEVVAANAGDHPLVLQLLVQTRQAALADDFQSRLDEPGYSPSDRLLIRRRHELVAHVQATRHIAWFDGQRLPVVRVDDLAALPEFAPAEYRRALLRHVEKDAVREGACVLFSLALDPEPFLAEGWVRVRSQFHTQARTRAVLAHLEAQGQHRRRRDAGGIEVRTWRLFELESIERLFDNLAPQAWGSLHRTVDAWRWLAGRKAHTSILLAVDAATSGGRRDESTADSPPPAAAALGYAVVRDSRVVEMLVDPAHPGVRTALLARACRDALDRDHQYVSLHTSPDDPLHELIVTAGGNWASLSADGQWMVKLADPDRWVERMYEAWRERAVAANVDRPVEIAFRVDGRIVALMLTRRSARLERRDGGGPAIECSRGTLQELLLGNVSISRAVHDQLLPELDGPTAALAGVLLPRRHLWQSPWEMLRL